MTSFLLLNHNLRGEATWYRAWNLARQLAARGHEVTLVTVHPRRGWRCRRELCEGVRIIETPFWGMRRWAASGLDAADIICRLVLVLRGTYRVLYGFSSLPNVSLPLLLVSWLKREKIRISDWDDLFTDGGIYEGWNHGWRRLFYRIQRGLEYSVRRRAHGVTATSHFLYERARTCCSGPVWYLPSGCDSEAIPVLERSDCLNALHLPKGPLYVGFLGGGFNEDVVLLLQAFQRAHAQRPRLRLLMVGDWDPRYDNYASDLLRSGVLHRFGRVQFNEVPRILGASDILAMPLHDGFNSRARGPIKLKDYLCAGRPIVGVALGEVAHVLSHYALGATATPDPESFAHALLSLVDDPVRREREGRAARNLADHDLSWSTIGEQLNRHLEDLMTT